MIFYWIILFCIINGLIALLGGISLLFSEKLLNKILLMLVALSAGALLSAAFFHLIPESIEKIDVSLTFVMVLAGFIIFFLTEKFLFWHHCHDSHCEHSFNYLILYGDAIHNFIDGVVIAASFLISVPFGITTSIAILSHEIPQELGNFGVLIYGGFKRGKALFFNFLAQMSCLIGGILGYFFSIGVEYIIPIAAGGFIYISASDLIPELRKEENKLKYILYTISFICGIALLFLLKVFLE